MAQWDCLQFQQSGSKIKKKKILLCALLLFFFVITPMFVYVSLLWSFSPLAFVFLVRSPSFLRILNGSRGRKILETEGGNVVITVTDERSWTMQLKAELERSDNVEDDCASMVYTYPHFYVAWGYTRFCHGPTRTSTFHSHGYEYILKYPTIESHCRNFNSGSIKADDRKIK